MTRIVDRPTITTFLKALYRDAPKDAAILLRIGESVLPVTRATPLPITKLAAAAEAGQPLGFAPALRDLRHTDRVVALPVIWVHTDGAMSVRELLDTALAPAHPVAVTTEPDGGTLFWRVSTGSLEDSLSTLSAISDMFGVAAPDPVEFCALPTVPEQVAITDSVEPLTPAALAAAVTTMPLPPLLRSEPVIAGPVRDAVEPLPDEDLLIRTSPPLDADLPPEANGAFAGAVTLVGALAEHQRLRPEEAWLTWAVREAMRVFGQRRTLELLDVDSVSTIQEAVYVRRHHRWYRVVGSPQTGFQLEMIA